MRPSASTPSLIVVGAWWYCGEVLRHEWLRLNPLTVVLCLAAYVRLGLILPGLSDCLLEDLKGVHVMEQDGDPLKFVCPSSCKAFCGVIFGEGDVWGEFLRAWGKEELVVYAAEDASGVWVDLEVDDLGVIGASDSD